MRWVRGSFLAALLSFGCACAPAPPGGEPRSAAGQPREAFGAPQTAAAAPAPAAEPSTPAPAPRPTAPPVDELTRDMIREVVRANYDKMAACYQRGLTRDPAMKGTIEVSLAINGDGSVVAAKVPPSASEIRDAEVVGCVVDEFQRLRFPASKRGMVNTIYPIVFAVE